jgi:phosphomannomutase
VSTAGILLTCRGSGAYSAAMSRATPLEEYRCPGEKYTISHAVHMGRLARFYPACRRCAHAAVAEHCSARQARRWAEVRAREAAGTRFDAEGLSGTWHNELSPAGVAQFARALGIYLRRTRAATRQPLAAVVADDGRTLTGEAVAAALDALRWTGCHVIHVGAASAPCVALAVDHWQAAGALLVGNTQGRTNTASLKLWAGPRPLSSGHGLEAILQTAAVPIDRPARTYGELRHVAADEPYLAALGEFYYALRPLRLVLACTSMPTATYLRQLAARVACQVLPTEHAASLADAVPRQAAHFGAAIDDDGERCALVDEQGRPIPAERVLLLLARHFLAVDPGRPIVLEPDATAWLNTSLLNLGGQTVRAASTRAAMEETMRRHRAILGGGPSGRFWYACGPAVPDALRTLTHLLVFLSRSDRRMSEVLDAEAPAN